MKGPNVKDNERGIETNTVSQMKKTLHKPTYHLRRRTSDLSTVRLYSKEVLCNMLFLGRVLDHSSISCLGEKKIREVRKMKVFFFMKEVRISGLFKKSW